MTPDKAQSLANDLNCAIATLQAIAEELATSYTDSDYRDYANEPEAPPEPPAPKPLTLEDVRGVLADISRSGKTAEIKTLLGKYGADKLSAVDPTHYASLLTDAEGIAHD
jgi:hypothetical protein